MTDFTHISAPASLYPARKTPRPSISGRWAFAMARTLRDEGRLALWSDSTEELAEQAQGIRIALVGNARSLGAKNLGSEIDAHDIVLRMNTAPMTSAKSHGRRTDWLATSVPLKASRLEQLNPQRVMWMTRKRKRLPYDIARRPGFFLNPVEPVGALARQIGGPPSTGAMVMDLVHSLPFKQVTVFGFDFFASLSNSGRRTADQVPHDFNAEREHAYALFNRDDRFTIR